MDKNYVDDIGVLIEVDCGSDISQSSTQSLKVLKPDGTEVTWSAAISGTNFLVHTTVSGDLDQAGTYKTQTYINSIRGETGKFTIFEHFA